jgi:putative ABC transport system permease protein
MWVQYWAEFSTVDDQQQFQQTINSWISEQKQVGRFSRDDAAGYMRNVEQWLAYNEVVGEDNSILVGLSFMFLVVCLVNAVGLLLAKFLRQASEVGVRRALGASQLEVFKQHLVEVSLIGFFGGILGLVMAVAGLAGVRSIYNNYDQLAQMDLTMIVVALLLAVSSSILAGVYPAYRICRTSPAVHLKTQ